MISQHEWMRPLVDALKVQLTERGDTMVARDELEVTETQWRRAARTAGAELGRKVRTMAVADKLQAWLTDWPRDDEESRVHQARLRAVMNSAVMPDSEV